MKRFPSTFVAQRGRIFFMLLFPLHLLGQTKVADQLLPVSSMEVNGSIGKRLNASYENRILAQDVNRLVEAFNPQKRTETRMWQTEFWGKWFTSAVLAYRYKPEVRLKKVLDEAVNGLLATQTPDGYIGNYAPDHRLEQWDVWGRKYCMLGLLAYYDLTGQRKVLQATARLADNLLDDLHRADGILVTKGNYRGMAASSVLEPIVLLYARTKQKKYLDFAEEIVRQWERPEGPQLIAKSKVDVARRFPKPKNWYSWEQGQKAYEMMSCYEGLLELYRITGRELYRKAVEDTWQNIYDTEINIAGSGAAAEMWFGGKARQAYPILHNQETCVTVTWIKLTMQLFRLTGEARYAEAIERSYYNALLGAMSEDGTEWAKYTPLTGQRLPGSEQCGMGLNCCEASGPRGLFLFPLYALTSRNDGISVNFYVPGNYKLKTPQKKDITFQQETAYPANGKVVIRVHLEKPEEFTFHLRIPSWSKQTSLKVNGEPLQNLEGGGYASLRRNWKEGDELELQLDMHGRVEKTGTQPAYFAVLRGPVLLVRDEGLQGPPLGVSLQPLIKDEYVDLMPDKPKPGYWMVFKGEFLPEAYTETGPKPITVALCDYASAGYSQQAAFFQSWIPMLIDPKSLGD